MLPLAAAIGVFRTNFSLTWVKAGRPRHVLESLNVDFIFDAIPKEKPVRLAVFDRDGFHALEFPCRRTKAGLWVDAKTGWGKTGEGLLRHPSFKGIREDLMGS